MFQKPKTKALAVQKVSPVTLALQLSTGERLMSDFKPEVSLWEILEYWEKQGKLLPSIHSLAKEIPVCVYLRKEIAKEEALKKTTLADLGLLNGKAAIRYISKAEGLTEQPHVGGVLLAKSVSSEIPVIPDVPTTTPAVPSELAEHKTQKEEPLRYQEDVEMAEQATVKEDPAAAKEISEEPVQVKSDFKVKIEEESNSHLNPRITSTSKMMETAANEYYDDGCTINFLNESGFLVYARPQQTTAGVKSDEDEQDDFFELTEDDLRKRMHELVHQRRALEEAHFLTAEQRAEKEKERQDKLLRRYPLTLLRVQFSDGFIFQMPLPSESTIYKAKTELRNYIADESDFELFTAPPKNVLETSTPLHILGLTPSSLIYISSHCVVKEEYRNSPSSFTAAARDAYGRITAQDQKDTKSEDLNNKRSSRGGKPGGSDFAPKWLKLGKK